MTMHSFFLITVVAGLTTALAEPAPAPAAEQEKQDTIAIK